MRRAMAMILAWGLAGPAQAADCPERRGEAEAGYTLELAGIFAPSGELLVVAGPSEIHRELGRFGMMWNGRDFSRTIFQDACGLYQVGYRLDGTTLHFPSGATHGLQNATAEQAEQTLRDAYGLTGPRDRLIRTKLPEAS